MKFKVLPVFVILNLSLCVHARLGDTPQNSVARFGSPLGYFKDKYAEAGLFERQRYVVFVIYRNGRSIQETYALIYPNTRKELYKEKYFYDWFKILNDPLKLMPLSKKQVAYLRKVNLKTTWQPYKTGNKNVDGQYAVLGKRKVRGDYYAKRHVLVVTEETAPAAPKATGKEIKQAKILGLPVGSYFKRYMDKYGVPFKIVNGAWGGFQQKNIFMHIKFKNDHKEEVKSNKEKDITYDFLIRSVTGKKSTLVMYVFMRIQFLKKYNNMLTELRNLNYMYRNREKISMDDYQEIWNREAKISCQLSTKENRQSIRPDIVNALLEGTTGTKWQKIWPRTISGVWYSTWKEGRRLYAVYDIALKSLSVEYGMMPGDYDREAIKKANASKDTKAMVMF